jgi:4-phytase/acid phosphatase
MHFGDGAKAQQTPPKQVGQSPDHDESQNQGHDQLEFVLVLTRHGVRSPTWTNKRLDEYAKDPWPQWPVAPGLLTPHGKQLMTFFGAYDRAYLADRGLLSATRCSDAAKVYIWADTDERTRETGAGLADGLMPGCHLEVHALEGEAQDELFHAMRTPDVTQSRTAFAALAGRIGDHPEALASAYQEPLTTMQRALLDCRDAACEVSGKKNLLSVPASIAPGSGDHLTELKGPLSTAATFAENLQLEYLEGMPDAQVGWGRVNGAQLESLMALHAASSDLVQRTPTIARLQAAHLLETILSTLWQAESGRSVTGAMGAVGTRVVFLVGHDTNIANVAALLDAHWLIDGYQRDDAAPGGALVFELWRHPGRPDTVKLSYWVETPDQMRQALPLSLTAPPASASIFLPACSLPEAGAPCTWGSFQSSLQTALGKP